MARIPSGTMGQLRSVVLRYRSFVRIVVAVRTRFRADERVYGIALVLAAGAVGALAAVLVRYVGSSVQWIATASLDEPVEAARRLGPLMVVLTPAAGGLAAGLLTTLLLRRGAEGGEGISEIMEAVSLKGAGRLHLGRTLRKSLASVVLNATGGSVGREGPIVQMSAAAASKLAAGMRLPVERRRVLMGAGVAAGMAAAYNAPIGAAMFVMEVVHGNFALDIFGPVVLASITGTMISWGAFGSDPLYPVPAEAAPSLFWLPLFAALGAVVAWTGLVLRLGIEGSGKAFAKLPLPLYLKTALGGLVVGLIAWKIPEVWGNGYDGVKEVLTGRILLPVLLPLLLAKIVATSASLGSGGSGGVFTPALLVGAAGGALFGAGADAAFGGPYFSSVFYALAGMTAAIASTTFAPITGLILVFEMCQNYGAVMPLAVATVTASWVARRLRRDSIYTDALRRRGVDFDLAFEQMALASLRAEDLIRRDVLAVRSDAPLREVLDRFTVSRQTAIYVRDPEGRLIGAIDLRDAFQVAGETPLRENLVAVDLVRDVPRITPRTPLDEVMARFAPIELDQLPVVSPQDASRLLGSVARRDVVQALDREVLRRRMVLAQYLGGTVPRQDAGGRRAEDLAIRDLEAPVTWVGRTLQELDPYRTFGLFVLAVRRKEQETEREICPAPPDLAVREGDLLVLLGTAGAVDAMEPAEVVEGVKS